MQTSAVRVNALFGKGAAKPAKKAAAKSAPAKVQKSGTSKSGGW